MHSSLCDGVYLAHSSNYTKGRNGYKICKFTPHIMAGKLTGKQCAVNIFGNPNRNASANYCIGNDGDLVCNVEEENRAWTSGNRVNDFQAITVEVSNNVNKGPEWTISDKAWNTLVNLAVDVCKRYNFKLVYDGTPNGSLTRHNMFQNTDCPGKYLQGRFKELADTVNARLEEKSQPKSTGRKVGDVVTINGVYISSTSTKKLTPATKTGKITKIVKDARNPYLLENGNIGWTNESCIVSGSKNTLNSTVGQTKILKALTTLWSNSNLSGTRYTYLPNTSVKILKNISLTIDYIYIPKTGRYAYTQNNVYK